MKPAVEILEKYWNKKNYQQAYFVDQQSAIIAAINEARIEAITKIQWDIQAASRTNQWIGANDRYFENLIKELK